MKRAFRSILVLPLVFVVAAIAAFLFEEAFRRMVRSLYRAFTHNKLYFIGKNFHLTSDYFIITFALFCVLFTTLIWGRPFRQCIVRGLVAVGVFFLTIVAVAYFNSTAIITTCTACKGGRMPLRYSELKYDGMFMTGLAVSLLPLIIVDIVQGITRVSSTRSPSAGLSSKRQPARR